MNKQIKSRIRPINTENKLMVARGKMGLGLGKMGEGEQEIQASSSGMNESQDERYSIGNILNGIVIASGDRHM